MLEHERRALKAHYMHSDPVWQGLTLLISTDMMYDPRLQIYCNPLS